MFKILFFAFSVFYLLREALSDRRNRHFLNFKLPHDVVCACAKRDEPPSRRRPANPPFSRVSFFPQILQHDGRRLRGIVFFRVFIGLPQIRVHSCAFVVDNRCLTLQFKPLYALSFMNLHSIVSLISTTATCRAIVIDPAQTCIQPLCRQTNGLCRCPPRSTSNNPSSAH